MRFVRVIDLFIEDQRAEGRITWPRRSRHRAARQEVADRTETAANVMPHTLRHAYCDHVARHAGLQVAQQAMGDANLATTELYLSKPTLHEVAHRLRSRGADRI